jgi:WD40 repeat protein
MAYPESKFNPSYPECRFILGREISTQRTPSLGFSCESLRSISRVSELDLHDGCVNTVKWNRDGRFLVTGSDDRTVKIWDFRHGFDNAILRHTVQTSHRSNIFCAESSPGDPSILVSCAADGTLFRNDLNNRHGETRLLTSDSLMCVSILIFPL